MFYYSHKQKSGRLLRLTLSMVTSDTRNHRTSYSPQNKDLGIPTVCLMSGYVGRKN
jgi:hypothetical protein